METLNIKNSATNIIDNLKADVIGWIKGQVPEVDISIIENALEVPKNEEHGDCCLPIPKLRLKGANPKDFAKDLAQKFVPFGQVTNAVAVDAFLNFSWDKRAIVKHGIPEILSKGSLYGRNQSGQGKRVVIDFASPNIAKPFHAGHLRSSVIGNFTKHVHEANGYKVTGINYLGDWGKQYGLLAVGYEKYGDEKEIEKDAIRHLFEVYVKINSDSETDPTIQDAARAYFRRMEEGDPDALALWRKFRNLSIEKYKAVFERLNIHHEVYSGESFYESAMKTELDVLRAKNLLKESQGAQVVDLSDAKLGNALILKKDGATVYITRDIAAAHCRYEEYKFDKMLYVVCSTQELHFRQLFKVLDKMGYSWVDRCEHVSYGLIRGMSTRKGTVVFLEDIMDEARDVMHGVMKNNPAKYAQIEDPERTADILALSAIVIQDFSAKRIKDYDFDWQRMTSFEGDTGPYLQYTHTRLCSIERKVPQITEQLDAVETSANWNSIRWDLLPEPQVQSLLMYLLRYPQIVKDACRTQEPCLMVTYLMTLAHQLSTVIEHLYVLNQAQEIALPRLAVYRAARHVLANGLYILGLPALHHM